MHTINKRSRGSGHDQIMYSVAIPRDREAIAYVIHKNQPINPNEPITSSFNIICELPHTDLRYSVGLPIHREQP
ncbi:hypothetical protein, partial [Cuspidothrix issatschenkoi]|uniref:hypothetical protein n=1 Tax=Cuspidothrix issatschenkoi TaxID=230752 RepID=UPI001A9C6D2B